MDEQINSETPTEAVQRLAKLSKIDYATARKDEAKDLKITVGELDAAVKEERAGLKKSPPKDDPVDVDALEDSAWELISSDDALADFVQDFSKLIAGELRNAKLLYLSATSRLFLKAMHVAVKGPSSAGKSEIRKAVLAFIPPEDIFAFTCLSEKALLYTEGGFEHKILSMGEAAGNDEQQFQDMCLRELMSEGKLVYQVPQKVGNEIVTTTIEKSGPVAFWVTTTRRTLHPENETRMLSLEIDDSERQTRAVLSKVAEVEGENAASAVVDFRRWHDYQRWLAAGDKTVTIPFARALAAAIPPKSVRLRRDLGQLYRAIKAHALLHRHSRDRDERRQIIASIDDDYRVARELMHDLLQDTNEAKPKATVIETVEAVKNTTVGMANDQGATAREIGKVLRLDKSAARRRLLTAEADGFVTNLETGRGRPGRYRATGQAPDEVEMLPSPEHLKKLLLDGGLPPLPPDHREGEGIEALQKNDGGGGTPPHLPPQANASGGKTGGNLFLPPENGGILPENGQGGRVATVATGVSEGDSQPGPDDAGAPDPDNWQSFADDGDLDPDRDMPDFLRRDK